MTYIYKGEQYPNREALIKAIVENMNEQKEAIDETDCN